MVDVNQNQELKCIACRAVFYDNEELLRSAGTKQNGEKLYNTVCPNCGNYDTMSEEYVGVPDEQLKKADEREIKHNDLEKTKEQLEKDKEQAKHHSEF